MRIILHVGEVMRKGSRFIQVAVGAPPARFGGADPRSVGQESKIMVTETSTLETLKAAYETARRRANQERTPEARDAAIAAWAAYDAASPPRKVSSYASRAGKRQAAERRGR